MKIKYEREKTNMQENKLIDSYEEKEELMNPAQKQYDSIYTPLETILITAMMIEEIPLETISGIMCALPKEYQKEDFLIYLVDNVDNTITKNQLLRKVYEISKT